MKKGRGEPLLFLLNVQFDSGALYGDDSIGRTRHLTFHILLRIFSGGGCWVPFGLICIVGVPDVFPRYLFDVASHISTLRYLNDSVIWKMFVLCFHQCGFEPVILDNCHGLLMAEFKSRVNVGGEDGPGVSYLDEVKTPPL